MQRVYANQSQISNQQILDLFDQRDQKRLELEQIQNQLEKLNSEIPNQIKIKATQILSQVTLQNIKQIPQQISYVCQQSQHPELSEIQIQSNQQPDKDIDEFIHLKLQLLFDSNGTIAHQINQFIQQTNTLNQKYQELRNNFVQWQLKQENEIQEKIKQKTNNFAQNFKERVSTYKKLSGDLQELREQFEVNLQSVQYFIIEDDKLPIAKSLYSFLKDLTHETVDLQPVDQILDKNAADLEIQQLNRLAKILIIFYGLRYSILQSTQQQNELITQFNKLSVYDDDLIKDYQKAVCDGQNILNENLFILEDSLQECIKNINVTCHDIDQTIEEVTDRVTMLQQCSSSSDDIAQICQQLRSLKIEILTYSEELKAKQAALENCDSEDSIEDDLQIAVNKLTQKSQSLKEQEKQLQNQLDNCLVKFKDLSNAEIFDIIVQSEQSGIMSAVRRVLKHINQK